MFLAVDHSVYVSGDNSAGQIGPIGLCDSGSIVLSESLSALDPTWVACGDKITSLLTDDGCVFACGTGYGTGPVQLSSPVSSVFVTCGPDKVCSIGTDGSLVVWWNSTVDVKRYVTSVPFCDCAAGASQVLALTTTGVVYAVGRGKACGQGRKWRSMEITPVTSLQGRIVCRIFSYCNHSVALDENGRVYSCGDGKYGQLGLRAVTKTNVFTQVRKFDGCPVAYVSLGDSFTAFVTEKQELYTCGDPSILGMEETRIPRVEKEAAGKKVSWVACGCLHMIFAENMHSIPEHPGRRFFGLDGHRQLPRRRLPKRVVSMSVVGVGVPLKVDVSDYGMMWTGFLPGDQVESKDFGVGTVEGISNTYLIVSFAHGNRAFDVMKHGLSMNHDKMVGFTTLSNQVITLDVSETVSHVFGFCVGDIVRHRTLGQATVAGMHRGCLWFSFDNDDGKVSTASKQDPEYLHSFLQIMVPKDRSVTYCEIDGNLWPIETAPCTILSEFSLAVGDLVDGAVVGVVRGTFRCFAVIDVLPEKRLTLVSPSSVRSRRHIGKEPVLVQMTTLRKRGVSVNVSCSEADQFMSFDRIVCAKGTGTVIGTANEQTWLALDDTVALGAGICVTTDTSHFTLIRRLTGPGSNKGYSVSCDSFGDLGILPADEVLLEGIRYTIVGMDSEGQVMAMNRETNEVTSLSAPEISQCSVVYRADLPATRSYLSKTGCLLDLQVSLSDFIGKRFLPDDVVETPHGTGVVIGVKDSFVAIHLFDDQGFSLFSEDAVRDPTLFQLKERRAIATIAT